jgi:hypothetical protein
LEMAFAAIYVPEFMVQAVVRTESATGADATLRGRAIALIDGKPPLWNVVAANAQALNAGIFLGMTKANAAQVSGVELRTRSLAAEKTAHAGLRDVGWSVSPRLEETAADLLLLDISGLSALLGSEKQIAELLLERSAQCGLQIQVAVAENALVAEIAARGFPPAKKSNALATWRSACFPRQKRSPKRWNAGELKRARRWPVCQCCNCPSASAKPECVCANWPQPAFRARWLSLKRNQSSKKKWN